ncbi:hypothetical protein GCM10028808_63460 [Spirosoma migulaei]
MTPIIDGLVGIEYVCGLITIADANRGIMANPYSIVLMKFTYPSVAFARIISTIKRCCYYALSYRDLAEKECINEYVNQALNGQDLIFWNRLRAQERAAFSANPDSLPDDTVSLRRFNLLLQRYKREGIAYYQLWKQAQATIRKELGVKTKQV